MAGYVGNVGDRISVVVTLKSDYTFETSYGWKYQTNHIYTMVDDADNTFVWKTSSAMTISGQTSDGDWWGYPIQKGDKVQIKATVKAHSSYKGQEQTEIQRVKVLEMVEKVKTKEEIEKEQRAEQMESLNEGDYIWTMPYRQYKEHYADCEVIKGSFNRDRQGNSSISVIIRNGRLKKSGVRGEHFKTYVMTNEDDMFVAYRAVCEENAYKRVNKEFPDHEWKCTAVYRF